MTREEDMAKAGNEPPGAGGSATWMIYGATGYTGRLIAQEAVRRGQRPVLAGRDPAAVAELARQLDLPSRIFSLDDAEAVARALASPLGAGPARIDAVLHCAGPFV